MSQEKQRSLALQYNRHAENLKHNPDIDDIESIHDTLLALADELVTEVLNDTAHLNKRADDAPNVLEAAQLVLLELDNKPTTTDEIFVRLIAKRWAPNCEDPKTFLAYILSSKKAIFERSREPGQPMKYQLKSLAVAGRALGSVIG